MMGDLVARARDALTGEAWRDAFDLLAEADRSDELDADSLEMLADAAYLVGEIEASRHAAERLYLAHLEAGDNPSAAAAAARVAGVLLEEGLMSPLRGWVARARALLSNDPDSSIHGTLANVMMWAALASGDGEGALEEARRAIEVGTNTGDAASRALGRNGEGRALILLGHIDEGLAVLDESTVAAMSGELDAISTAALYCSTVCALQGLAEYDRAEQWTRVMERWVESHTVGPFRGWCRVHKAEILRLKGQWPDAEREALAAFDEVRAFAGVDLGWPLTEVATIRLRTGDLEGAHEAFMRARENGWEPQPGLALLRLARGDVQNALNDIQGALDHPPPFTGWERPPNTHLRRAPLLAALVEIAATACDLERAATAADELDGIAETVGSGAIRATAATARGAVQLLEGDTDSGCRNLARAASLWKEIGAPFESAHARAALAAAHRASGDTMRAEEEYRTALSTFRRLGAKVDARHAMEALADISRHDSPMSRVEKVFMFTDIVRSTDLVEVIGDDAWRHLVRWHNQTLGSLVRANRGDVVRTTGDGFFVTFDSARDAIGCAVAVQRALDEHRREHGFAPQVRIGLHAAEATPDGADWSGAGIHVAARIAAAAEGSEILVSVDTAASAGDWAESEPRLLQLKGVPEPCEVVAIDWRRLESPTPWIG